MAGNLPPGPGRSHRAARRLGRADTPRSGWGLPYRRIRDGVRIFLMWARDPRGGAGLDPGDVARTLRALLAPLFAAPLETTVHADHAAAMVFLERPGAGWAAPFRQEDAHGRAFAVDYPVGVPRVLAACGRPAPAAMEHELPALGRALAED